MPAQIGSGTDWKAVSAGSRTVAIRTDGTLWTWGQRLECLVASVDGCTTDPYHLVPTQIGAATNWATVSAGALHAVAIRADGTLWTWGRKPECSTGPTTATTAGYLLPPRSVRPTNWATVSAGTFHTLGTPHRRHAVGLGRQPLPPDRHRGRRLPVRVARADLRQHATGRRSAPAMSTAPPSAPTAPSGCGAATTGVSRASAGLQQRPVPYQVGTDTNWATVDAGSSHTVATPHRALSRPGPRRSGPSALPRARDAATLGGWTA